MSGDMKPRRLLEYSNHQRSSSIECCLCNSIQIFTLPEMAGSSIADITEVVDRFLDLTEVVEGGLLAALTEVLEPCLEVADLAEAAMDAADLTDDVDAVFRGPITEVDDLTEVPDMAFIALPTEVVDSCLEVSDRMDVALFVPTSEVVEL